MKKFFIGLTLTSGLLLAQGPGSSSSGAGQTSYTPDYTALKAATGITDAEITALRNLQTQQRQAAQAITTQIQTQQTALQAAIQAKNAAAIGQAVLAIEGLRAQINALNTTNNTAALAAVSATVKTTLPALQNAQKLGPAVRQAESLDLLVPLASPSGASGNVGHFGFGGPRMMRHAGPPPAAPVQQ